MRIIIDDHRPGARPGDWVLKIDTDAETVEAPTGMPLSLAIAIALNQAYDQGIAIALGTSIDTSFLS